MIRWRFWRRQGSPGHEQVSQLMATLHAEFEAGTYWEDASLPAGIIGQCHVTWNIQISAGLLAAVAHADPAIADEAKAVLEEITLHEYAHAVAVRELINDEDHVHPTWLEASHRVQVSPERSTGVSPALAALIGVTELEDDDGV